MAPCVPGIGPEDHRGHEACACDQTGQEDEGHLALHRHKAVMRCVVSYTYMAMRVNSYTVRLSAKGEIPTRSGTYVELSVTFSVFWMRSSCSNAASPLSCR